MFKKMICMLVIIMITPIFIMAENEADPKGTQSDNIFLFSEDKELQGVYGSLKTSFNKDEHWEIQDDNYLRIFFRQTDISRYENSTMTIYFNDKPLKSIRLSGSTSNVLKVELPIKKENILEGENTVSFRVYNRIDDNRYVCDDIENPANWILIDKRSFMHLNYKFKQDLESISDFPYPYMVKKLKYSSNANIVIPANANAEEVQGAIKIKALFSKIAPDSELNFKIYKESQLDENLRKSNLIFINRNGNIPKELSIEVEDVEEGAGYIREVNSPYASGKRVLVISKDIDRAIKALSKEKYVEQMLSSKQIIDFDLDKDAQKEALSKTITFKDLNYGNAKLEGMSYQKANYFLSVPTGYTLKGGSYIELDVKYSKALNFDKSVLTVYINDLPVTSKRLSEESADGDSLKFEIPKELLGEKNLSVDVVFFMSLIEYECDSRDDEHSWALVSEDSHVEFNFEDESRAIFENSPYPFLNSDNASDILFLIEDLSDIEKINHYSDIYASLSKVTDSLIDFEISDKINEKYKNYNIILIESPEKDGTIKEYNEKLYLKYDSGFNDFLSNEEIKIVKNNENNILSIQLVASPINEERKMMVITAPKAKDLILLGEVFRSETISSQLKGNVVLINEHGVKDFAYYGDAKKIVESKEKDAEAKGHKFEFNNKNIAIIVFALVILGVLTFIGIIVYKDFKNRR